MNLSIVRYGKNIVVIKDFTSPEERGEVAHFLAELEVLKKELLILWEEMG